MKKVIVTGVTGQDGSYMVDYLLEKTDSVIYGAVRRTAKPDFSNLQNALKNNRFKTVIADLADSHSIDALVRDIQPDYFINFAAQSFVGSSWLIPEQTFDIDATGVIRCLEAIRKHRPSCRFYNAGSSEEIGDVLYTPQNEQHPPRARSPYGAAKVAARQIVKVYRESYGLYAIQGMLYNHESERRGLEFVTRKITLGVSRIVKAIQNQQSFDPILLGNLDALRDWSYAPDFIDGVWLMLNQKEPKEYVLSSGEMYSVRSFVEQAFKSARVEGYWTGSGLDEKFIIANHLLEEHPVKSITLVEIDKNFFRPAEVDKLCGDSSLARKELGWQPKVGFKQLVDIMVKHDLQNENRLS